MKFIESILSSWKNWKIWEPGSETSLSQKHFVVDSLEREPQSLLLVWSLHLALPSQPHPLSAPGTLHNYPQPQWEKLPGLLLQNQFCLQGPAWRVSEGRSQGHMATLIVNTWGYSVVQCPMTQSVVHKWKHKSGIVCLPLRLKAGGFSHWRGQMQNFQDESQMSTVPNQMP